MLNLKKKKKKIERTENYSAVITVTHHKHREERVAVHIKCIQPSVTQKKKIVSVT